MRTATISLCFMGENALEHPFYRVFSLISPARAMKRPPGRPEPKMSWFYKGFSKEKCRFMKAFKTGFSRPGRGGAGFGLSYFDHVVDTQNWGTQTASLAARIAVESRQVGVGTFPHPQGQRPLEDDTQKQKRMPGESRQVESRGLHPSFAWHFLSPKIAITISLF